jgi:hypothetical protein
MKHLLTLTVTALALAAFSTTVLAGDCGSCPAGAKKDKAKDKTEESTQS